MKDTTIVETGKKWEFNEAVASVFENMLERSIPQYDLMRKLVLDIGERFIHDGSSILDIGCSNGLSIKPFIDKYQDRCKYAMLDVSEPMLDICRKTYERYQDDRTVLIVNHDITKGIDFGNHDLILSILTLQFTPIEYRHKILDDIYKHLNAGGCLMIVEKVLGSTHDIDDILVDEYYGMKRENEYTQEQIKSKRKSLEGVLVPITEAWNIDLLKSTGFRQVDCFWRCLNFAGWIAIK